MPARKTKPINPPENALALRPKRGGMTQPSFLGNGSPEDLSALVDIETGEVHPTGPPEERLNNAGKLRLIQLILSGENDTEIAKKLVEEKFVLRYTTHGVYYWRDRPEVIQALAIRNRAAFQVGWASKEKRVSALAELLEAMRDEVLILDTTTNKMRLRQAPTNAFVMLVKEYRSGLEQMSLMLDDPPGREVTVTMQGGLDHNHLHTAKVLGMNDTTREGLMERLKEAGAIIEADFREADELPDSLSFAKPIELIEE